jgi:hypothetical protein
MNFREICDMNILKKVQNDIAKLKLFPFYIHENLKNGYLSLPTTTSINSWNDLKEAYIKKALLLKSCKTDIISYPLNNLTMNM